ncbi:3,4-dihydroxy-2-butanone-4-phosphate synthase [Pyrobaculum calidifontis]|uniref:3,4-dihydroxy-2-butanone 4-phosphate synthase n=1 Tax=Pyrobaculum calidifontis (strain DSM 21063 / JCM 11548 / VA1) TaxID=410359 RepID=A3MV79_PYRCJ|nr:3,4-dihydroxy-2-butanone-4-phosphate synthase [Pyrobaculum calidifontis]ABO08546.1 3,4-dihydroxy-2-butanone 4-phosphate synthase [Pyrobaculum calidifontis JCM 11548]
MIEEALKALRQGRLVMIYDGDGREAEVDYVVRADAVTPDLVHWLRKNAGGLLCFATTYQVGKALGLDFLSDLYKAKGFQTKAPYGDDPAFMGYVNHVKTKTGVRDVDKAVTINELARVVSLALKDPERAREEFVNNFYLPGHVPVLGGRIGARWGHTELSLILAQAAGLPPAVVIIEALGDSREAMSLAEAKRLADALGIPLLTGEEVKALA